MSDMNDSLNRTLDLHEFESAWQRNPHPHIERFLEASRTGRPDGRTCPEMLIELVLIDLEQRWKHRPPVEGDGAANDPSHGKAPQPPRPLLEDYLQRFPQLGLIGDLPSRLIREEYRIRHRWGDAPDIDEYRRRFGAAAAERACRGAAVQRTGRLTLKLYSRGRPVYRTEFSQPLVLGRQRRGEPLPYRLVAAPNGERLLIAPLEYTKVSRRHLQLAHRRPDWVDLTVLTDKGDVLVCPEQRVRHGETVGIRLPALIGLGELAVRLMNSQ